MIEKNSRKGSVSAAILLPTEQPVRVFTAKVKDQNNLPNSNQLEKQIKNIGNIVEGFQSNMAAMYNHKEDIFMKIFKKKIYGLQQEIRELKDQQGEDTYVFRRDKFIQELLNDNNYLRTELARLDKLYKNHRNIVSKIRIEFEENQEQSKVYLTKISQLKNRNIGLINKINQISNRVSQILLEADMEEIKNEVAKLFEGIVMENETAISLIQSEIKVPKALKRMSSQEKDNQDQSALMQHKSETFITANDWRSTVSVRK